MKNLKPTDGAAFIQSLWRKVDVELEALNAQCDIFLRVSVFLTLHRLAAIHWPHLWELCVLDWALPAGVTGKLFLVRSCARTWGNLPNRRKVHFTLCGFGQRESVFPFRMFCSVNNMAFPGRLPTPPGEPPESASYRPEHVILHVSGTYWGGSLFPVGR